jgi:hypothetical protein
LRTLFVVVTIFGVWLGWNLKIVRERKAICNELARIQPPVFQCVLLEASEADAGPSEGNAMYEHARISWLRRLMGDASHAQIAMHPPPLTTEIFDSESTINLLTEHLVTDQLIGRVERAFPEAELIFIVLGKDGVKQNYRDSLYKPAIARRPNIGSLFKTGVIEKPLASGDTP